jgi:hypothetical protein
VIQPIPIRFRRSHAASENRSGFPSQIALGVLVLLCLTTPVPSVASTAPYPPSQVITGITWDLSTVLSLRKALGSDIWPLTWASDGNLYGAWGDGGGFDGTEDSKATGRTSLGFARVTGTPAVGDPASFAGRNVWGQAPAFAENQATFGGKVDDLISVGGVLYGQGGLWTTANCNCSDPTIKSGDNPTQFTLTWSSDLGKTWQIAPWTSSTQSGSSLQFGPDYRGAFDPAHVYYYFQQDINVDPTHVYLRRVLTSQLTADPATPRHFEYFTALDASGSPLWSTAEANAAPVFTDPNIAPGVSVGPSVVYDAALGRYWATEFHGNSTGQLGFFEGPTPWGPWATVAYYDDWGGFNATAGVGNGMIFPSKWISSDGKTLWAVFSGADNGPNGPNDFDSFNVAKVVLTVGTPLPQITAPTAGTVLIPGELVTAQGTGANLSWVVDRVHDGQSSIATSAGPSITFTVPSDSTPGQLIRISLTGRGGNVYRDYAIASSREPPGEPPREPQVTLNSVSTGKSYRVSTAQLGALAYIDRPYTLTDLSPTLAGNPLIEGSNDDKRVTSPAYLQFTLDRPATVFICYSPTATQLPAWLNDGTWSLTSERCDVNDGATTPRLVYKKAVPAREITLGGNRENPAAGRPGYSNYLVVVTP